MSDPRQEYFSLAEADVYVGTAKGHMGRLIRTPGGPPATNIAINPRGKPHWRIARADLDRWLADRRRVVEPLRRRRRRAAAPTGKVWV